MQKGTIKSILMNDNTPHCHCEVTFLAGVILFRNGVILLLLCIEMGEREQPEQQL